MIFLLFYAFDFSFAVPELPDLPDTKLCTKKYRRGQDCRNTFEILGTFTTAYPWSLIRNNTANGYEPLDTRPAVEVDHPDKLKTRFFIYNNTNEASVFRNLFRYLLGEKSGQTVSACRW